jgi:hypothetical protein
MNAKRWFPLVCLALLLVSDIFLFHSNHQRDAALSDLRGTQQKLLTVQTELDALKNSAAGQQANDNSGLRKQNELLSAKVAALQKNVEQLQKENLQASQHLTTARSALQMQQDHLQQLQADQDRSARQANVSACINNLRLLDAAKQQWALDKQKNAADVPTAQDLQSYFKEGILPACPDGGTYTFNAAGELPTCSVPGHVLPPQ